MTNENYVPLEAEKRLLAFWEKEQIYKFDENSKKPVYSIDSPPPTVSGKMHIGHAFSYSQQDFIARFKRMQGFNVFYPFGTDDNGLPTERLVEKMKGIRGSRMPRDEFVKVCYDVLKEILPNFVQDWKNIGISCDWNIYYSTINKHSQAISQRSFIQLYKAGREYQKEAPTIWCTECQTAIAQVEMQDKELPSFFNDIVFKCEGKDLIIATTRPELLSSCVAVFAHPTDERYKSLFGKKAKVPLFNHEVVIMPDERADPNKGTGIVMCCTFGDQTDIEWYKSHNLPLKISIAKDGRMTALAGKYAGLKIKEARKMILEDLKIANLLTTQKSITHTVKVHERCGIEVEILETKQWFIKYLDMKEKLLEAGQKLNWYPEFMRHRYENWIRGLQWDWCISRQRFFGIPFPVWYCKKCSKPMLAEESDLPVDPLFSQPKKSCSCGSSEFEPEKDVLDTWATSSLTPLLATELFKDKPIFKKLFPMSLRPQAHEIITFWLFNTVVKSLLHSKKVPWKDVMISGFVTLGGEKMSKSKGNTIEPQAVLQKFCADALRYWSSGSKLGDDMDYIEKDLVTGQKTVTKLWNASKFVLMNFKDIKDQKILKPKNLEAFDAWVLSKLNTVIKNSTESFENYEYSKAKQETDLFFWKIFCDNYLEVIKERIYAPEKRGQPAKDSALYTLDTCLLSILKLFAPILPFVTEEIYQSHYKNVENVSSIHISEWPKHNPKLVNADLEKAGDKVMEIVTKVRRAKSEKNLSVKTPVKRLVVDLTEKELEPFLLDLKAVTSAEKIEFGNEVLVEI
ncbi:MAG: valine--tRNA ligase [Nanoarchaeota archaeon]